MQIKELRGKNAPELEKLLTSKRNEWRDLKYKNASGQLKNFHSLGVLRKDIARIMFLLSFAGKLQIKESKMKGEGESSKALAKEDKKLRRVNNSKLQLKPQASTRGGSLSQKKEAPKEKPINK